MPSSYSASLRFTLQATGENNNTWGSILNTGAFALIDTAISGWLTKALVGNYSLTTANGAADEARSAMLKFTGTGTFTVTIPAVSKRYDIWNACTGVLTVSNGSASVTVQPGEKIGVITDGGANIARLQPTDFASASLTNVTSISGLATPTTASQAASKSYVDSVAFVMAAGALPGQGGNFGKFLTTDGTNAGWSNTLPTFTAFAGVTSAFPALKRSGLGVLVRLADDSAYTYVDAANYYLSNGSFIGSAADGSISLRNSAGTSFGLLQFGGLTSSFPALKRNAAELQVRLADDTGYADFRANNLNVQGNLVLGLNAIFANSASGQIVLYNNVGSTFGLLQFGGLTSSFPALKRNGATLEVRLADDSGYAGFNCGTASAATVRTGTDILQPISVGSVYNGLAEVTLSDNAGATIAVDMSTFMDAVVTFTGTGNSRTLGNPTNPKVGQTGFIRMIQSSGGSNSLSFGANWKRRGGAATLTTTANATDLLEYQVITSTFILYDVINAPS